MNKIKIDNSNKYNNTIIAKWIREELKTIPEIKCSVRKDSGSIYVTVKESQIRFIKKIEEVTENEIFSIMNGRNDSEEEVLEFIKKYLSKGYLNLNIYHIDSDWSLTDKGKEIALKIKNIMNKHNWDNSDIRTDYFNVNYYCNISLGTYEKAFVDGNN